MNVEKRAIVIFPPFEEPSLVEILRRQFDPQASKIKAHITLVFPFESEISAFQLRSHIERAVQGLLPFSIRLSRISGEAERYLYLNVKQGNDQFIALHDRLYSGPLEMYLSAEHTFLPHVTVGCITERAAFLQALASVEKLELSFDVIVREVAVCRIQGEKEYPVAFKVGI